MTNRYSTTTVDVTRLRFDSERAFDAVKTSLLGQMGRITSEDLAKSIASAATPAAFEHNVNAFAGASGFMLFSEIDHSHYLPLYGLKRRALRLIFGNPAVAATMTQHDIAAGLFAPVSLLLFDTEDGGSTIIYDLPSSLMQAQKDKALLAAAKELDRKMLALVTAATGIGPI